ncbi:MAG: helicase-related protein [Coriobacteriales bacterium]|nr:helicase-related protein [Coriobacteriales bacterium]
MARPDLSVFSEHEVQQLEDLLAKSVEALIKRKVKRESQRKIKKMAARGQRPHAATVRKELREQYLPQGMSVTFDTAQAIVASLNPTQEQRKRCFDPFCRQLVRDVAPQISRQLESFDRAGYLSRKRKSIDKSLRSSSAPRVMACRNREAVERLARSCNAQRMGLEAMCKHFDERARINISADVMAHVKKDKRVRQGAALFSYVCGRPFGGADVTGGAFGALVNGMRRELRDTYDEAHVLELLEQNEVVAQRLENERYILTGIMERIPRTPQDAYPLARSIERHFVLHVGPTNSGKTHDALEALAAAESGAYLGPLRLLAFEQFMALGERGVPCSLVTGEEQQLVEGARHVASTIELADLSHMVELAVIDEAQMLADEKRGHHWCETILGMPAQCVHVCMAPQALGLVKELVTICGDTFEVVQHERLVPLIHERRAYRPVRDVREGDALIVFSRNQVHRVAARLARSGLSASLIYGALPHAVRHAEATRFANHETQVVVATDAIGMGMNLPIRRVVFLEMEKYDGREVRELKPEEVRQIAGRAGRFGIYDEGYFCTSADPALLRELFEGEVPALEKAHLGFPGSLLGVNGQVSELMEHWAEMEVPEPFAKEDLHDVLRLVRRLEHLCPDATDEQKRLIYTFATMAFEADDHRQMRVWESMFLSALAGEMLELELPRRLSHDLAVLERQSSMCDLQYQYYLIFGGDEELGAIQRCRDQIEQRMRARLSERAQRDAKSFEE